MNSRKKLSVSNKQSAKIIFLIAYCLPITFFSCNNKPKEILGENEYYVCSMDPQVLEKQMGMCPICKMPLAKVTIDKNQRHIIKLNLEQKKLANVAVDTVKMSSIGKEIILTGVFAINQNKTEQISARINGRIEKLYHKIIGEEIKKGEPVYDLYSRDLMLAQEEYLFAIEKSKLLGDENIIHASKNKLLLWGLSDTQISGLEKSKHAKITNTIYSPVSGTIIEIPLKEGDIAAEGSKIYQVADLNSLWVEAQIYPNELRMLDKSTRVEIIPEAFPEEATEGSITFSNPALQQGSKINIVRSEVKNPDGKFKPGMQANMIIHSEEKQAIVLPIDAVIRDARNTSVWIQNKEGGFEPRIVETGIENKFGIEITSGLNTGELVVVSGAYLINSEYIFKLGMMPMDDMKMEGMNINTGETKSFSDTTGKREIDPSGIKTKNATNADTLFKVQIKIAMRKVSLDSPAFAGVPDVSEYMENGIYKYTSGNFTSADEAVVVKNELRKQGFADAFVIAFKNGLRVEYSTRK